MSEQRYLLVYHHPDDGPTSVRTWTKEDALEHAGALNRMEHGGRWAVHEFGPEVE